MINLETIATTPTYLRIKLEEKEPQQNLISHFDIGIKYRNIYNTFEDLVWIYGYHWNQRISLFWRLKMRLKFCQLFDYTQLNEEEMSYKKIKLWKYHNHMLQKTQNKLSENINANRWK